VKTIGPILISANSFWNIANFREELVEALVASVGEVALATPDPDKGWADAHGAVAIDLPMSRSGLNPFADFILLTNYVRLLRRIRPAYFLGFTAKPNIYGSLAASLCGVTSLPNVSGLGTVFIKGGVLARLVGLLYRLAFRNSPVGFFQNSDDRDLFVRRGIVRADQGRIIPGSGIDLERFSAQHPSSDGEIRFLFVGRLLGDKGVREFVEAARLLRSEFPAWRFQLLGDVDSGNRTGVSPAEVDRWVEEGLVEHLGFVSDIRPYIAASTAVVLPSYREGMPRSLLEAAAIGRPLIASDVPGNRQLVDHGRNGYLCNVRDGQSLANALRKMGLLSSKEREQMGQAARTLVEKEFGLGRVIEAYLSALRQLASEARVRTN
jgi:glycosyltransferase involved in cell wall biosynthesis